VTPYRTTLTRSAPAWQGGGNKSVGLILQHICTTVTSMKSRVIVSDPNILSGTLVFRGTRVPLQTLIDHLEAGDSIADFLEGFPTVKKEQVIEFLEETKERFLATA
jgi:uncharacterized protein (DUF433 family)